MLNASIWYTICSCRCAVGWRCVHVILVRMQLCVSRLVKLYGDCYFIHVYELPKVSDNKKVALAQKYHEKQMWFRRPLWVKESRMLNLRANQPNIYIQGSWGSSLSAYRTSRYLNVYFEDDLNRSHQPVQRPYQVAWLVRHRLQQLGCNKPRHRQMLHMANNLSKAMRAWWVVFD